MNCSHFEDFCHNGIVWKDDLEAIGMAMLCLDMPTSHKAFTSREFVLFSNSLSHACTASYLVKLHSARESYLFLTLASFQLIFLTKSCATINTQRQ